MIFPSALAYRSWSGFLISVSLALCILHIFIMLCCFTRDSFARTINEHGFMFKVLFVCGLTIGFLFLHNDYLRVYVTASSYLSILFVLYQSITLIDFGYVWNEKWLEKYENGTTFYGILLILGSILLFGLTILSTAFNFNTFWIDGCHYYKINLVFSVLLIVFLIVLVLLKIHQSSSILTALFVSLVFSYYNGLSLGSYNDSECNPFSKNPDKNAFWAETTIHILVNVFAGMVTILCLSVDYQSSNKLTSVGLSYKDKDETAVSENEIPIHQKEDQMYEVSQIYQSNYFIWFHFVMALFSIYIVMIFFDWRNLNINVDSWSQLLSPSASAFYIKTLTNFVFVLLYIWTLIAPSILANRQFS